METGPKSVSLAGRGASSLGPVPLTGSGRGLRSALLVAESSGVSSALASAEGLLGRLRSFVPQMAAADEALAALSPEERGRLCQDPALTHLEDQEEDSDEEEEEEPAHPPSKRPKEEEADSDDDEGPDPAAFVQMDLALLGPQDDQEPPAPLVQEIEQTAK